MKTYPYPQDQIMEYLQEAADNGEVIQLTYYGGTRPGEARSVVPTTVYKTRFHGICIDSNIEKHICTKNATFRRCLVFKSVML